MSARRSCLVLVRHGETDWNASGRWQGHGGGGLSALGHTQARATAGALCARFDGVAFVARSDLRRVAETAGPIVAELDAREIVDLRLRELDCGDWTGYTHPEIAERDPERYAAWQAGEDVAPGGGERVREMQERVTAVLSDLLDRLGRGETAVVVTHGGPIRVGVAGLRGRQAHRLDDACAAVANCSLTTLVRSDGHVHVEEYGDVRHLDELASEQPAGGPL